MRRTSEKGIKRLKQLEGEQLKAYRDSAGIWTIGVGHTGREVHEGMTITREQSDVLLRTDLHEAEAAVNRLVKVQITDYQFDALVIFVFNIGTHAFANSTLLRKLNAGDYNAVPAELMKWNKITVNGRKVVSHGLTNRRAAEVGLWSTHEEAAPSSTRVTAPSPKPLARSRTQQGNALALTGTTGASAMELASSAKDGADQLSFLAEYSNTIKWLFIGMTLAGIILSFYGRWRLSKEEGV